MICFRHGDDGFFLLDSILASLSFTSRIKLLLQTMLLQSFFPHFSCLYFKKIKKTVINYIQVSLCLPALAQTLFTDNPTQMWSQQGSERLWAFTHLLAKLKSQS